MFFCDNHIACGDDNIATSVSELYVGYSTFGAGHGCSIVLDNVAIQAKTG